MIRLKCKNSVFCAQFLLFFLIGTISGIWMYWCSDGSGHLFLRQYCELLERDSVDDISTRLLPFVRPLILAFLFGFFSWRKRAIPVLVLFRGALTAYAFCAVAFSGLSAEYLVTRGIVLLPVFYWLCLRSAQSE